jgi:glycosyltransferase involved in cell wall biosynthesis
LTGRPRAKGFDPANATQSLPRMRLTLLNQYYTPDISPTAHLAASLAEHRAAHGDIVTVIASRGGYVDLSKNSSRKERLSNPRVIRVWTPQFGKRNTILRALDYLCFYVGAALRLAFLARQDVIVSLTTPPFVAATVLIHKVLHRRVRFVLWNMDCYPEVAERTGVIDPRSLAARAMRALNRYLFKKIDQLVCLDAAMQELLLSSYAGANHAPAAVVIPNWEKASFFPGDASPPEWSEIDALGLRGRFVVLYLGNTGYGHSFDTVLEAAKVLRDEPVSFLFVGGGHRWREIEVAVKHMRLTNVVLRGYVPKEQTLSVMKAANCALITLQDFALGVMSPSKLHANLAMGLPVIYVGPPRSNVDEAIETFDCGISLRHGQVRELVEFIRRLVRSPQSSLEASGRARQAFEAAYCDIRTLPQFDKALDALRSTRAARLPTGSARENRN